MIAPPEELSKEFPSKVTFVKVVLREIDLANIIGPDVQVLFFIIKFYRSS